MAEHSFQEVMKQWRRFCKSHNHCGECEFDGKGICGEAHLAKVPMTEIETHIMQWAAEHPEPVYTSWVEWLVEQGVLATAKPVPTLTLVAYFGGKNATKPIPADIAQKLGLKPKEG